ncbi:MAG: suppressor of fused domain protein [Eubacterium sp.]|nr:suppressor of fused domain protein [Eubacterium sp.]
MIYNKKIFQIIHNEIKSTPKVISFADDSNEFKIDIYIGENKSDVGLSTYSTLGLSKYPIGVIDSEGKEIRVEFIGVCDSDFKEFPNIIASCAFDIIKNNYSCRPGMININAVEQYYDGLEMRHIYYTAPSYWENLQGIELDGHIVNWLFAIPISDSELEYLEKYGDQAFEELLEEKNTEVFDIYRDSVV